MAQAKWSKPRRDRGTGARRARNRTPSSGGRTSPIRWTGVPVRAATARDELRRVLRAAAVNRSS